MEQKHLENLCLEEKQETILIRITEKVRQTDILKDNKANEWIFQYVFNWQKRKWKIITRLKTESQDRIGMVILRIKLYYWKKNKQTPSKTQKVAHESQTSGRNRYHTFWETQDNTNCPIWRHLLALIIVKHYLPSWLKEQCKLPGAARAGKNSTMYNSVHKPGCILSRLHNWGPGIVT